MKHASTIQKHRDSMAARSQRLWERDTDRILGRAAKVNGLTAHAVRLHLDPAVYERESMTPARRRLAINAAVRSAKNL